MKNIILVVLVLSFCVGALFAQPVYGGRLGLNMGNITANNIQDNGARMGLHIGGMMQYPIAENILIQPELLYSMKGVKWDSSGGFESTWAMDYLEIPVMVKYDYVMPTVRIQPYLGPSFGILLSAKDKWEGGGSSGTTDFKDHTNALDVGLNIGADVVFMKNFMAGLRYNMGLANVQKDPANDDAKYYTRTFMINFGYLIGVE